MSRPPTVAPPERWRHDPEALRELLRDHNLTGAQAGALIGVDGRTIRRWTAPAGEPHSRQMPYSAWFCLVHRVDTASNR